MSTQARWTQAHIDELENMFPELVDEDDPNKLLRSAGKREVVRYVREKYKQSQKPIK